MNYILSVLYFSLKALLLSERLQVSKAAHSARRQTIVKSPRQSQYDRTITTFSDEGRLLQVEYAMEASRLKSNNVICLDIGHAICVAIENSNSHEQADKIHRIDDHCFLITTGLVGDGNALAHASRLVCQRLRREKDECLVQEVAEYIAGMQHDLTRRPGARPFGVTATVIGADLFDNNLKLFQSDPGGSFEEYDFCSAGKDSQTFLKDLQLLHSSLKEENVNKWKQQLLEGLGKILLNESYESSAEEESKTVDIWLFQKDEHSRSGMNIQCAKYVSRDHLKSLEDFFQ